MERREAHDIEFVAIDGEGITIDGEHHYVLICATGCEPLHKDGERLTTQEIFHWFYYTVFRTHPNAAFVGFFLGYDITQWLRDLPPDRGEKLFLKEEIEKRQRKTHPHLPPFPVYWERFGWEFDLLGDVRFKLRPYIPFAERKARKDRKDKPIPWMFICDAGPFYQTSFLNAVNPEPRKKAGVRPVCSDEEYVTIKRGKDNRENAIFGPEMIRYCQLEVDVSARLLNEMNRSLVRNEVRLNRNQFFGPGQVASGYLDHISKKISIPDLDKKDEVKSVYSLSAECHRSYVHPDFWEAAKRTYYGGWFEIFYHGRYPGTCYEYDINSAYPKVMTQLPCLLHGKYLFSGRNKDGSALKVGPPHCKHGYGLGTGQHLCIVDAKVFGHNGARIGAMLHRGPDGFIKRPVVTRGWYWLHELEAAKKAGVVERWFVYEWLVYRPCNCPRPLAAVAKLYEDRIALGENGKNSPDGVAKKLTYNSIYGKFAQSVGNPKYANPIYASLITAGCRCMILNAIASHQKGSDAVLMIAMDGIVFTDRHENITPNKTLLGAFDMKSRENLTLVKPGTYFDDNTIKELNRALSTNDFSKIKLKSRGINIKAFAQRIPAFIAAFENFAPGDPWPTFDITIPFRVTSGKQAAARGKWFQCGRVTNSATITVSADPKEKRAANGPGWSRPYQFGGPTFEPSTDYDGSFGDQRAQNEDLYGYGEHPDGYIEDQIAALQRGDFGVDYEQMIPQYDDEPADG